VPSTWLPVPLGYFHIRFHPHNYQEITLMRKCIRNSVPSATYVGNSMVFIERKSDREREEEVERERERGGGRKRERGRETTK